MSVETEDQLESCILSMIARHNSRFPSRKMALLITPKDGVQYTATPVETVRSFKYNADAFTKIDPALETEDPKFSVGPAFVRLPRDSRYYSTEDSIIKSILEAMVGVGYPSTIRNVPMYLTACSKEELHRSAGYRTMKGMTNEALLVSPVVELFVDAVCILGYAYDGIRLMEYMPRNLQAVILSALLVRFLDTTCVLDTRSVPSKFLRDSFTEQIGACQITLHRFNSILDIAKSAHKRFARIVFTRNTYAGVSIRS